MATHNGNFHFLEDGAQEQQQQEEEEEEDDDEADPDYVALLGTLTGSLENPPSNSSAQPVVIQEDEEEEEEEEEEEDDANSANGVPQPSQGEKGDSDVCSPGVAGNYSDATSCPVCMEPCFSEGVHRICCLPCGHLYGRSCIERWIRQSTGRCPQCNKKCKMREIRNIYASHVVVANEDLEKEVFSLRAENKFLKMQNTSLLEEVNMYKKCAMEYEIHKKEKLARIEQVPSGVVRKRSFGYADERRASEQQIPCENIHSSQNSGGRVYARGSVAFKAECCVDGGRVFDMDVSSQMLILCRRPSGMAGPHVLTKVSLLFLNENENILLPPSTIAVKDIRISLPPRRLTLLASMGRTISIFSTESNNIVLTYNLPAPAWSCSWDLNNPHHVYAGLQNGMVTMFDLRQTMRPLECINGLSSHPVHTLHSLVHNGVQSSASSSTVLTASSVGPCLWNIGNARERPFLIPGMENQGVCTSLAYCDTSNDIIATFRPKVNTSSDTVASQPSFSPPSTVSGPVTWGSHILLKQADDASYQSYGLVQSCVSAVRFQKSAIISKQGYSPLFTYGDETTNGLYVRDLRSLEFVDSLGQNSSPILDVKYAHSTTAGLLGCISEKKLQLFTCFEH